MQYKDFLTIFAISLQIVSRDIELAELVKITAVLRNPSSQFSFIPLSCLFCRAIEDALLPFVKREIQTSF